MADLAAIALVSAASTGCVGVGWIGTERTTGEAAGNRFSLERHAGALTTDALRRRLGDPDERVVVSDTEERWTYDQGLRWNGPVIFAVIGLPLVIPVGRDEDTYHIVEGVATTVDRVHYRETHYTCGFIPGYCTGFGCERWGSP